MKVEHAFLVHAWDSLDASSKSWVHGSHDVVNRVLLRHGRAPEVLSPATLRHFIRKAKAKQNKTRNTSATRRIAREALATPRWANLEIIELIYAEARNRRLTVDHILPLQGQTVCGLHVHNNMQLLTVAENSAKGNR